MNYVFSIIVLVLLVGRFLVQIFTGRKNLLRVKIIKHVFNMCDPKNRVKFLLNKNLSSLIVNMVSRIGKVMY